MVTAGRATDLDVAIPRGPGDRPRTLDEAKAFLTRHLLVGRMPFPRQPHREVYETIQALSGLDGANWAATWAAPADRHQTLAEQAEALADSKTALAERLLAYSETLLQPADIVVQRGTNHAWDNRSDAAARAVFVLIAADFDPELEAGVPNMVVVP